MSFSLVISALISIVAADMVNKQLGMSADITGWFVLAGIVMAFAGLFVAAFTLDVETRALDDITL